MSNLLDIAADLGSSEDEDYDEDADERPRERKTNGNGAEDDSSEEEDDDDEEAERAVREGFIVDEDEDDDAEAKAARRREKRKRRREQREEEEELLDEEDLDLIGEANPEFERRREDAAPKFKRLKQGHRRSDDRRDTGNDDIFSDEEDVVVEERAYTGRAGAYDEFDDFIEQDVPDEEQRRLEDDREVARPGRKLVSSMANLDLSGVDEGALEDYRAAFGDGDEYSWALDLEMEADIEEEEKNKELELKNVFQPSELVEKLLTDEDDKIRSTDVPERLQMVRKLFKHIERTPEEAADLAREEVMVISSQLALEKRIESSRLDAFRTTISKVLEFLNQEDLEIPFIKHYRRDYLIQKVKVPSMDNPGQMVYREERMLNDDELWDVFDADIKFRELIERRDAAMRSYDGLRMNLNIQDEILDELLPTCSDVNTVQDLQDYMNFQYSAELKDVSISAEAHTNGNGIHKKASAASSKWERIRASRVYSLVRHLGPGADALAQDLKHGVKRTFSDDPTQTPVDMADELLDPPVFNTGDMVLQAARAMAVQQYTHSPRLRKFVRDLMFQEGQFDCIRTEKGAKQITEDSREYEFKYLRNQPFRRAGQDSELFLRMLKAETEGLVSVKLYVPDIKLVQRRLRSFVVSDNLSEVADEWNKLRQQAMDDALDQLLKIIAKGAKDFLRSACEDKLAKNCRDKLRKKLDRAPYKPFGLGIGTVPNVFAISNGSGDRREGSQWVYVKGEEGSKVVDHGKLASGLRPIPREKSTSIPPDPDVEKLIDLLKKYKPDVIAISGWSTEAKRLASEVERIVEWGDYAYDLTESEPRPITVSKDDRSEERPLPVVMVNDECARLYHTTERAKIDNPHLSQLGRYCFGLARSMQNPTAEYIALGTDSLMAIKFSPDQELIPQDKLLRYLEMAMVEMVNLIGLDINDAYHDPTYLGQSLKYIAGLGPRKVTTLLKAAQSNDGFASRSDFVGDPDNGIMQGMTMKIFQNAAGFLYIPDDEEDNEPLDETRIHPEDYDLARKIVADALGLDEEDIAAENSENGPGGVVRRLKKEDRQNEVEELELDHYAEALLKDFNQHKRATLELIRSELEEPHEELRLKWDEMTPEELVIMLTGETAESLQAGMNVPVKIRRFLPDELLVTLDCGLEGHISQGEWPDGLGADRGGPDPRNVFQMGQVIQAKLTFVDRKRWPPTVQLSIREKMLKEPFKRQFDFGQPDEWDHRLESEDRRAAQKQKDAADHGRAQRVIKHPLFQPFNSTQAEEFLGTQAVGAVVIRPSSRGFDHLTVTWKVADNVYQHVDVLEMKKDNEFALGKLLRIGNYTYSDLDELIANHVQAMARKVEEMMHDERFQKLSKREADEWLTTYTEANPRRSMYAFCINPKYPGYFFLIFKEGLQGTLCSWNVKVVPNAFELNKTQYPDMRGLRNGLKMQLDNARGQGGGRR